MVQEFESLGFSQKVRHKMSHDRRPILSELADKAGVKNLVAEKIGPDYVVPTYQILDDVSELDFSIYPREFVLKPTHGSQTGILVSEKFERLDSKLLPTFGTWEKYFNIHPEDFSRNHDFVKIMTERWLGSSYRAETEFCYQGIKPRVIVEKYIDSRPEELLFEFRFYTFHGSVRFFRAAAGYASDIPHFAFNEEGDFLPVKFAHDAFEIDPTSPPSLPDEWQLMKSLAEKLSMGIDFIRVDFVLGADGIYFSELTNYPFAGTLRLVPKAFDRVLSSYWRYCDVCLAQEPYSSA
jgi:hypothetical protein